MLPHLIAPGFALLALASTLAIAAEPLRITGLQRCGDVLSAVQQQWCVSTRGLAQGTPGVHLDGHVLPAARVTRDGDTLRLNLDTARLDSGPLWLQDAGGQASNPVWLSLKASHVVPAGPGEVAKNMDGLTTYVDLVSLLIEERHDGLQEARRLADKYGAKVVGAIAPLNVYQLRLPVSDLVQRDAMVLRLGSEVSVDAVVIEESAPEKGEERESADAQARPGGEEWAANRFMDAVNFYQRRIPARDAAVPVSPVRIGVIERDVDFDAPDFADYLGPCRGERPRTCLYARDADKPDGHGSTVAGVLAARWEQGGNTGFLRGLDPASPGFEVIVERNSDAGITANIAASVNLVEDGVRVLNWSWGIHRVGAKNVEGDEVDSLVRSGLAMSGYEELLEEFFLWLRKEHQDVVVINSAGNGASYSGTDEYRLPSSFVTEQLLVVGGHQRSERPVAVDDPAYVVKRAASNIDARVDITAAACVQASTAQADQRGEVHCGTSYATPMVAGVVAAMLSINPRLQPEQLRLLLRRSAMTLGGEGDFEPMDAEDLTAPILPSERNYQLNDKDVGRSARLDMHKALDLAVQSRDRVR